MRTPRGSRAVVVVALAWLLAPATADASPAFRKKITINPGQVTGGPLTNFPFLFNTTDPALRTTANGGSVTNANGWDIIFATAPACADSTSCGGAKLDHEIERYNATTGEFVAWVRVPSIDNGTVFYLHYGDSAVGSSTENRTGVWDVNYQAVWHLSEAPANGTTGGHIDSKHNTTAGALFNNGTPQGFTAAPSSTNATGIAAGADRFSRPVAGPSAANDDTINVTDHATLEPAGDMTLETWVNASTLPAPGSGNVHLLAQKNYLGGPPFNSYQLFFRGDVGATRLWFGWTNTTPTEYSAVNPGPFVAGTWYHVAGVLTGTTVTLYVNGSAAGTTTATKTGTLLNSADLLSIGNGQAPVIGTDGVLDEVRLSSTARPAGWLLTQYRNVSSPSTFYSLLVCPDCCPPLGVTEAAGTVTVTAPGSFEMRFNTAAGGGIDRFFDLAEDPAGTTDLAAGTGFQNALVDDEIAKSGDGNPYLANLDTGGKLHLLEATSTRVRVRSESFYKQDPSVLPTPLVLAGVKGFADYTIQSPGRMGVRWTHQPTGSVSYDYQQRQLSVHAQGIVPLNTWAGFTQSGPICTSCTGPAGDDFVMLQNEQVGARTDFLWTLSPDWASATNTRKGENMGEEWIENSWVSGVGTFSSGAPDSWNSLLYFKPTNLGNVASPWLDPLVTSRASDYRLPSAITVGPGSQWQDANENTSAAGDFFNESEAAYVFNLNPATGLTFDTDGSTTTRYSPFFKVRQWRSLAAPSTITVEGVTKTRDVDYKADVKPVSRAHYAQRVIWHSTLENAAAVTSPDIAPSGTVAGGIGFTAARYGAGANVTASTQYVAFPIGAFIANRGAIEFWYQPTFNSTDGVLHDICGFVFDVNNRFVLEKRADNNLYFQILASAANSQLTVSSANYDWRAADWVHIRLEWEDTAPLATQQRLFLNGVEPVHTDPTVDFAGGNLTLAAEFRFGNTNGDATFSPGVYDEIYSYDTSNQPTLLGYGGLTTNTSEYLADGSRNFTLSFNAVDGDRAGSYFHLGSDAKFHGLNVGLKTSGAGVAAGALEWEYWNGTAWANLETVGGFTDSTNSFAKSGNVYWTSDPLTWSVYSVNGGPDLYYVRVHLIAGATYSTAPIEGLIKTDILLFQYCGDVTAAAQTFVFAPPIPTAVTLQSFSAVSRDSAVDLTWTTASELQNLGFHLHRADSAGGPYTRITSALIPGLGSSPTGQSYGYRDTGLVNGRTYYYELEDVETTGKTQRHGPVSATPSPAASSPPAPPPPNPSATTYGDPSGIVLREIERDARHVVVELLTGGFTATPADAGRVRLSIPGFESASGPGKPDLPMRRALVAAAAGRKVRLASVVASDVLRFAGLRPVAEGTPGVEATGDGSVVTSSRRVSEGAAFSGLFPAASARLEGVVFQGETKKANLLLSPLRWDGNSLELSRRLLVRLDFVGREAAETGLGGSRGRRVVSRGSHGRRGVVAQLVVKDRGLHRVDYGDVFSGRSEVLASNLRLSRQGKSVAFHVEPNPSRFGPGSSLYFLSEGSSLNPYGDAVYELETGVRGTLMPVERLVPDSTPVSEEIATLNREENRYYQAGLLDAPDLWLWDIVVSPASKSYPFTVDHVSSLSPGHVSVSMQGASDFEGVTDHHVKVRVNGVMVGEATWDGRVPQTLDFEVGPGTLREGANSLDLENVGDTGAAYSFVFLNRFSLRYPRTLVATQGTLEGSFAVSGQAAIDGLSSASLLLDTTESPRWLTGGSATASGLSFPVQAGRSYLATSTVLRPEVRRIRAGALKDATNRADYLLLAPKAFLTAAQPLLDRRESQGLATKAVSLEDVYEQFGHGETSPAAIKEFLEYAYQFWASPSPRYVLLLGDASYDPKDYLKTGVVNWLPGFPVKTSYLWTVSDPAYASVNGNDLVPDLAIGRLPASNAAEADRLVQKVLAFENGGGNFDGPAVLVADNADLAGNFEQDADEIAATILASRNPRKIYYSREGANTRAEIEDAFDQGASFLSYVGHGGTVVWASENIFNYQDVASLRPQSQQPLLLTMNCLNGFFHFPPLNSLSEELLKADGKGVIAAFSPSGLSVNDAAHLYHKAVLQEILSGKHERLGDAILAAQEDYAHTGAFPELLSIYHLFGDPAMRLR